MLHAVLEFLIRFFFIPLCGIKIYDREKIPKTGACIIYCNHLSIWDPFVMHVAARKRIPRLMAKAELFKNGFLRACITNLGAFPVDRGRGDIAAFRAACEVLKQDEILGIYPEGTRSKTGEMGEFKSGATLIATHADVPLVPMYISKKYRLFGGTKVLFGDPFRLSELEELSGLKNRELLECGTAYMRKKVEELKELSEKL